MKSCGSCNLCCKLVAVESLEKLAGEWCPHAKPGHGCAIYGTHPSQCQGFRCLWLEEPDLPDHWKPNRAKFVIRAESDGGTMAIDVDPGSPSAWRDPKFYPEIKAWSRAAWTGLGRVLVYVGPKTFAVFPEEDLEVGKFDPGDYLETGYRRGAGWRQPYAKLQRGGEEKIFLGKQYATQ